MWAFCVAALGAEIAKEPQGGEEPPAVYDLVVANGRVLDPESDLDGVRHLGIRDGRIAEVSEQPLQGREVIDATGLAVAPGFVDLHAHGQDPVSYDALARDGVTSAMDLELGAHGVKGFLRAREGEARIHYGVSAGHLPARIQLFTGLSPGHPMSPIGGLSGALVRGIQAVFEPSAYARDPADAKRIRTLARSLAGQIDEGGIGVGMGLAYAPGATPEEVRAVFELAAQRGVPVFVQLAEQQRPDDLAPLERVLALARVTGASLHVMDLVSSLRAATPPALAAIDAAREQGLLVTGEVIPYAAGPARIESARFAGDWRARTGLDYGDLQWVASGERLGQASFARDRKQGGSVIVYGLKEEWIDAALRHPGVLVASDAMPVVEGDANPRAAGSHARVLGHYVRERGVLPLMDALARMSWLPARRLEWCTPDMARKGRIRAGADADLVIFDPATVIDRASFEAPRQPPDGISYVLVAGVPVVRSGALVPDAFPGRPLRAHVGVSKLDGR